MINFGIKDEFWSCSTRPRAGDYNAVCVLDAGEWKVVTGDHGLTSHGWCSWHYMCTVVQCTVHLGLRTINLFILLHAALWTKMAFIIYILTFYYQEPDKIFEKIDFSFRNFSFIGFNKDSKCLLGFREFGTSSSFSFHSLTSPACHLRPSFPWSLSWDHKIPCPHSHGS